MVQHCRFRDRRSAEFADVWACATETSGIRVSNAPAESVGFRNPVLAGFHPDPSVCRVGDDYYCVTSSFTYFPGVPIYRSANLVEWEPIGHVLDRSSQLDLSTTSGWSSAGIYAPTLRYHDGRFWMIATRIDTPGWETFIVTAEDPAGPWTEPMVIPTFGIDPDLAWDNRGNCWLHCGLGSIFRVRLDDRNGNVLDGPHPTWSGTGLKAPEAPHLFQRGDYWYLVIAEGGTERGHAVSVARGPTPEGPWDGCPANPLVSHRSLEHPIQNTGHADLVEAPDGSWWALLLGVRPQGTSPGFHVLGRETFLAPVEWEEDWPQIGTIELAYGERPRGLPTATDTPIAGGAFFDDFTDRALRPQWVAVRRPPATFSAIVGGQLDVHGVGSPLTGADPAFLGVRQQHHRCRTSVVIDPAGDQTIAGLAVYYDESSHYVVECRDQRVVARTRIGGMEIVHGEVRRPDGPLTLVVESVGHTTGPDTVRLCVVIDGVDNVLAEIDGRYLSTEVCGGFIGRMIGPYVESGEATFRRFEYRPTDVVDESTAVGAG